jgi:hypothetical protein
MHQGECTHSVEERIITRTSVLSEVRKVAEQGYALEKIFEFWEFTVEQWSGHFRGLRKHTAGCRVRRTKTGKWRNTHRLKKLLLSRHPVLRILDKDLW